MSLGELELLSVPAGAPGRLLFIWKLHRPLMLFQRQSFSFMRPRFLSPQWAEGLRGRDRRSIRAYVPHRPLRVRHGVVPRGPPAYVQVRVLPSGGPGGWEGPRGQNRHLSLEPESIPTSQP